MGEPKVHALYERLRDDLVSGAYAPGERLSENLLAERYGVSRTPVREVLGRLQFEGLVNREGTVVSVPSPSVELVLDLFETRIVLETSLARCAAERWREADLIVLHNAAERCRALNGRSDTTALWDANRAFHHALGDAAHNAVLAGLQRQLDLRVAAMRATTLTARGRWSASTKQHDELVAAIEARDPDTAAAVAEQHLRDARELWLDLVRRA